MPNTPDTRDPGMQGESLSLDELADQLLEKVQEYTQEGDEGLKKLTVFVKSLRKQGINLEELCLCMEKKIESGEKTFSIDQRLTFWLATILRS